MKFLQKILAPLIGSTNSFVKNSEHFVHLIKGINLHDQDILISFNIVSLFINVLVEEVLQVTKDKLCMDSTLLERSPLQVADVMQLLEVCMKTTYFQFHAKFYQQKHGTVMSSSLLAVVSNIFMEHFEELALNTTDFEPAMWLRYVDKIFVAWPQRLILLNLFHYLWNLFHIFISLPFYLIEN
jgi:hypothetical protein